MTRKEFITMCAKAGYCDKETAETWAGDRDIFTERDFAEVWRYAQRVAPENDDRWRTMYGGVKTTKCYKTTGW